MANQKISQLPAAGVLTGTEVFPAVQNTADVGVKVGDLATLGTGLSNWVQLGNAGSAVTLIGDTSTGGWTDLGSIGTSVSVTG